MIVKSKPFEAGSLMIIIWNTGMMMYDPNSTSSLASTFDLMFLIIYTVEMGFKIMALGFVLKEGSYLRDYWNLLDFTIISTGYIPYAIKSSSINLSALRSLRVLRPLRSISKIKALKTILVTLFSAMPLIMSSVMVNMFFLLIFAIAGLQLFSGLLKKRCFNQYTGLLLAQDPEFQDPLISGVMCGYIDCPADYQCGKLASNPNFDQINFDTIFYSYLMIFQSITLEGWTGIMYYVVRSFSIYCLIFFIILAWVGAYFLVNITLAVICIKFEEAQDKNKREKENKAQGIVIIEEDEKIKGPSVIDVRNLKLCEKSHHKRTLRKLGIAKNYGANEEVFKKEKDEIRWDDLFELKERIREEQERLDEEESFKKMRDQELEGSNYKKFHKKKTNLKYLPKTKINKKNGHFTQKIVHNDKKLKFMGIQGVNVTKSPENSQGMAKEKKNGPRKTKLLERNRQSMIEKNDEEIMQLINLNEAEQFLQESSKKAVNFKEIKYDHYNISNLLRKPKIFKKERDPYESPRISIDENVDSATKLIKKVNTENRIDSLHKLKKTDEKRQSLKSVELKQTLYRKKTDEISEFSNSLKKTPKRASLQISPHDFQAKLKEKRKSSINVDLANKPILLKRKSSKRFSRKISKLSSFSGGEADGSNLSSTILNDSDFNIGGFEKPEKKKSLVIIPLEIRPDGNSPFLRNQNILHPTTNKLNTENSEENNDILPDDDDNKQEIVKNGNNEIIDNASTNKFLNNLKLQKVFSQAILKKKEKDKEDVIGKALEQEMSLDLKNDLEGNNNEAKNEEEPQINENPDFLIKDLNLSKKVQSSDPNTLLNNEVINEKDSKLRKKIKEKKMMRQLLPMVAFTQTDPENNNVDETDLENGQAKNYGEQISTRTHIDSKNMIEKDKKWSFLKRSLTFKKKPTEKKKKEDLEKTKRLLIQKKFNILNYKLMITGKDYQSNSIDDVWASRIENLQKRKEEEFEKNIRSKAKMPVLYLPKLINMKKFEKQRKKDERKMLRDIEKHRHDSIDFQTLTNEDIIKKILRISKNYRRLPLNLHRSLMAVLLKQRNAVYGERNSRSKGTSICTPNSKTNLTNQSMNFSVKNKTLKKKKKKPLVKLVYDFENLKEYCKEKLYDKGQIKDQEKEFQEEELYKNIWLEDFENGIKRDFHVKLKANLRWSGEDALDLQTFYYQRGLIANNNEPLSLHKIEKFQKRVNRVIHAISTISFDKEVWLVGFKGKLKMGQKYLRRLVNSKLFDHTMLLAVIINTVILAMDGLFYDATTLAMFDSFNLYLTMIFTVEMVFKIVADTPRRYVADKMNIFDGSVVTISQVELWALSGSKGLSAFRTVRIFRTFRVLRVTRLLRSLEFMKVIMNVIGRCIDSLIYIGCLLLLFIVIYSLIGIEIYSGNLNNGYTNIRQNFDTFQNAFAAVFQLMTVENWNDILTVTLNSNVGASITCLFLISWIFMGNYVFLNLILAILLEAFADEWEEKNKGKYEDFEEYELKELENKKKEEEDKEQELRIQNMEIEDLESELLTKTIKKQHKTLFQGVSCQNSVFLFPKTHSLRRFCYITVHSPYFENFILFVIVASSMKLAIDTYLPDNETINAVSDPIDYSFNALFTVECMMKVISFGFINDEGSYLRDNWNIMDFIIVVSSLLDMAVSSINLPFIKILRLLRTLRPLRFISHNLNMKIVVTALLESAGPIANVSIVVLLIFLMFSIFGMSMLEQRFGFCDYDYANGNFYNINIDMVRIY